MIAVNDNAVTAAIDDDDVEASAGNIADGGPRDCNNHLDDDDEYDEDHADNGKDGRLGLILGGALFYTRVTFKTLVVSKIKVP